MHVSYTIHAVTKSHTHIVPIQNDLLVRVTDKLYIGTYPWA